MRAIRQEAHPLLLIGIWALLEAAMIAAIAILPGSPFYADSGTGSLGQAVFFTVPVVFFVALGSRLAWWIAIFSATVSVALPIASLLAEPSWKPFVVTPLAAAALWLIWSGSIENYVKSGRRPRIAQLH
jgi:hypothetical protein